MTTTSPETTATTPAAQVSVTPEWRQQVWNTWTARPQPLEPRTSRKENGSPEIRTQDQSVKSRVLYR